MNFDVILEKIKLLCADGDFQSKLSMCNTPAEIAALFTNEGIPISTEEIEQLLSMASKQDYNEFDENALDTVAGGVSLLGRVGLMLLPLLPSLPITLPVQPIVKKLI